MWAEPLLCFQLTPLQTYSSWAVEAVADATVLVAAELARWFSTRITNLPLAHTMSLWAPAPQQKAEAVAWEIQVSTAL